MREGRILLYRVGREGLQEGRRDGGLEGGSEGSYEDYVDRQIFLQTDEYRRYNLNIST